ncbi:DNA-3-methyladenine glycosylase I [Candidatus Woesearchaeota archaeon]|nr:DNA-3-methyladenine glycosylase I [Candidatus Woesearchaeota archaeon]
MATYCSSVRDLPLDNVHRQHHDTEHGFPPQDDDDLFRRLMLEISQAGLSFETVLKKKKAIYEAFPSVKRVAALQEADILRLLQNSGIIRNRLKIQAAIANAQKIQRIQRKHGSFWHWLKMQPCKNREEWTQLFRKKFRFTGGEIVNEFLMSVGMLPGAHDLDCRIFQEIIPKHGVDRIDDKSNT